MTALPFPDLSINQTPISGVSSPVQTTTGSFFARGQDTFTTPAQDLAGQGVSGGFSAGALPLMVGFGLLFVLAMTRGRK